MTLTEINSMTDEEFDEACIVHCLGWVRECDILWRKPDGSCDAFECYPHASFDDAMRCVRNMDRGRGLNNVKSVIVQLVHDSDACWSELYFVLCAATPRQIASAALCAATQESAR